MSTNNFQQRIYRILTRDSNAHDGKTCKVKKTVNRALRPFIIIDPKCKSAQLEELFLACIRKILEKK